MQNKTYTRRHFKTFDALRFFAFFKVFLLHIPIFYFPLFNYFKKGGGIGVLFFFTLSGFLITYILLSEKEVSGTISLKRFYLRRILRIWPLYFLILGIAFITPYVIDWLHLTHSDEGYQPNWLMSAAFLENYQGMIMHNHPNVSPLGATWSLCVEEHFYILWGIFLSLISIRRLPVLIVTCIITAFISRYVYAYFQLPKNDILTNFDYFAYGAIPAWLLVTKKEKFEGWLSRIPFYLKLMAMIGVILYIIFSPNIDYPMQRSMEPLIFGMLFIITLCCILPEKNAVTISDRNWLTRLGVYTYGMYLYHTIIINMMVQLFRKYNVELDNIWNAILFSAISFVITAGISIVSYHFFEKYFLSLKGRIIKDRKVAVETISGFAGKAVD
jgi:peptidoglycan/LPS O-acetylase OafA/YrhL